MLYSYSKISFLAIFGQDGHVLVLGTNTHKSYQIFVGQVFQLFQFDQYFSVYSEMFDVQMFDEYFRALA